LFFEKYCRKFQFDKSSADLLFTRLKKWVILSLQLIQGHVFYNVSGSYLYPTTLFLAGRLCAPPLFYAAR